MPSTEATTTEAHDTESHKQPRSDVGGDLFGGVLSHVLSNSMGEPRENTNSRLSNPSLSHPVNSSFRSIAFKRAQQTHGNHFVQRAMMQRNLSASKTIQRGCACGGTCTACQQPLSVPGGQAFEAESASNPLVQTKSTSGSTNNQPANQVIPGGGGEPLAEAPRNRMESGFGRDFGDVRIHTDDRAAASAEAFSANAFTSGRDVYFARGKYAPESLEGQRLLAHELVHTLQQANTPSLAHQSAATSDLFIDPDDSLEQDADQVADQVVVSASAGQMGSSPISPEDNDVLDTDVERAPQKNMNGAQPPELSDQEGRKRRMSAPVQRVVQRAPDDAPKVPGVATPAEPAKGELPPGTLSFEVGDWTFTTDQKQLRAELLKVVTERGLRGLDDVLWFTRVSKNPDLCNQVQGQSPACRDWVTAKHKVIEALEIAIPVVRQENEHLLERFEEQAFKTLDIVLNENEKETRIEMVRYGITMTVEEVDYEDADTWLRLGFAGVAAVGGASSAAYNLTPKPTITYGMQTQSETSLGLADAAKILLERQNEINTRINEKAKHATCTTQGMLASIALGWCPLEYDDEYYVIQKQIEGLKEEFQKIRVPLGDKYPVLRPSADKAYKDNNAEELAVLANKSPTADQQKTRLVAAKLYKTLADIATVREAREENDINIWRLPTLVKLTKAKVGIKDKPLETKLVDEKVELEAPGVLGQILLLILNILAIVLAGPTGGLSLALAAGVNAAVAVQHIREYLLESALAGSGLGLARALSDHEPSLFWLAVEIVGVVVDVGAAAAAVAKTVKAFATLAPLAKDAELAAKGSQEAIEAAENLTRAARVEGGAIAEGGGEKLVKAVEGHLSEAVTAEEAALKATGVAKPREVDAFTRVMKASEQAAEGSEAIVAKTIGGGEVKATKSGLFSCHSPCTVLRERYSEALLARKDLDQQLLKLETELAAKQGDEVAMKSIAEQAAKIENELRKTPIGGWSSDLPKDAEFASLLERRGSAAERLTVKPPNWTGADEVRFRFGDKVDDLIEKVDGKPTHYWRLSQDGKISLVRRDESFKRLRFNEALGTVEEVDDAYKAATIIKEEPFKLGKLTKGERQEFEEVLGKRKSFIERRNALQELDEKGILTAEEAKELSATLSAINKQSERLGEMAAAKYMKSRGATHVWGLGEPTRSGVLDQVWKVVEKGPDGRSIEVYYVVEAKGGGSRLGTRVTQEGLRVQQGTPEYLTDIIKNMKKTPATENVAMDLADASLEGRVRYVKVQAPIGTEAGEAVLKDFQVGMFDLAQ